MYIAIDVGGTNVRIAATKSLDEVEFEKIERFELSHDFEKDFGKIIETIRGISGGKVDAIGIGTPGTLEEGNRKLKSVRTIPEWIGMPFVVDLSEEFDCPVFAENDGAVAVLGEAYFGSGKGDDFFYINWGTNVGGAKANFAKGDIEFKKFNKEEWNELFDSGFNEKCGGQEISKRFGKKIDELDGPEWDLILNDFMEYSSEIAKKFGAKRLVIGGGVTEKKREGIEKLAREFHERGIELIVSRLGDEGGLFGAIALIKNNIY